MRYKLLYIVTPASRLQNLPLLKENIEKNIDSRILVRWLIIIDPKLSSFYNDVIKLEKTHIPNLLIYTFICPGVDKNIAGHTSRNYSFFLINTVKDANCLIYFLDDDNLLHSDFMKYISDFDFNKYDILIFSQLDKYNFLRLKSSEGCAKVGFIDTAMFIFDVSILNGLKFREDDYAADGLFAEQLVKQTNKIYYEPKPLCYYNKLR